MKECKFHVREIEQLRNVERVKVKRWHKIEVTLDNRLLSEGKIQTIGGYCEAPCKVSEVLATDSGKLKVEFSI